MSEVSSVLLAAGRSSRMGRENKLLSPVEGEPMVRRLSERILAAGVRELVVVLGFESEIVGAALPTSARSVRNPDFEEGMGRSLAVGVAALATDAEGILIALADLPWLRAASVRRLLEAFEARPSWASIAGLRHGERRGHPVIFEAAHRPYLEACRGDEGARSLVRERASEVLWVESEDDGVWRDIDRPQDWSWDSGGPP
ncbi:MAG: nucleotidyltransferase family protein [Myxococcota bacterium]